MEAEPAHMISLAFAAPTQAAKVFTLPIKDAVSVSLATLDKDTLKPLYEQMAKTKLLDHIYVQALPAPALVAYLPYIYFFVLPMSIGDCYESMGNHAAAEQQYRSTLAYPYMNENVEATKVCDAARRVLPRMGRPPVPRRGQRGGSHSPRRRPSTNWC